MKNKEIKFETLKKSYKKYIIGGVVAVCIIGSALTFRLTHSKYRVTQSIDLGSGVINYKVPDFKIMAMYQQKDGSTCTDDSCYNEITDRMPSTGYIINTSKSYCTLDNINHDDEVILKTVDGNHVFNNLKKYDKCYLYFDKQLTGGDYILANIKINDETPDFSQTATTNEGVFKTEDGMYGNTTYYWRGAVTNNYVKFADKCWRIIRINGDKSVRMIYDGTTCHANGTSTTESIAVASQAYNSSYNQSNYVGWTYSGTSQRPSTTNNNGSVGTASNAKTQLDSWYSSNLSPYATFIADGKYCNDREARSGYTWAINGNTFYYAAGGRLDTNKTPKFSCTNAGDVYTLKIGLITADEVVFAGGIYASRNNASYYLYNGQNYWTMSPYFWSGTFAQASLFIVGSAGVLTNNSVHYPNGLRPTINLRSDVTFSSGNGTISEPYVVSQI